MSKLENILHGNQKKQLTYTNIFRISIFLIGLILFIVAWDIDNKLQKSPCISTSLKTCNKIVLSIGLIFMSTSASFAICSSKCSNSIYGYSAKVYLGSMAVLGITLIILGSIISANSTGLCKDSGNPTIIWGLGALLLVICVIYFYSEYYKKK